MHQGCLPSPNRKIMLETVRPHRIGPLAVRRDPLQRVITRPRPTTDLGQVPIVTLAHARLPYRTAKFVPVVRCWSTRIGGAISARAAMEHRACWGSS